MVEKKEKYIEEWHVLDAFYDKTSNETVVEFDFYFPNGEFDEGDVGGFSKEELDLWKSRIGKRMKVECTFDENGDRIWSKMWEE